jgi:uncharacterized protein
MHAFTNRLAAESSPYLLQHAHNPVDWYPWGEEALEIAKKEDKPILVSIGYSACHWCHVMEKESFEDEETAAIMNKLFICIKIDREERPDLDHIYMDAVQAITGAGGWPLHVFLTPDKKAFYGGTYFPPRPAFNRPSWKDVLHSISDAYKDKKQETISQAENLTAYLVKSNSFGIDKNAQIEENQGNLFKTKTLDLVFENIMKTADRLEGGFGKAPKFPQTFTIQFLLHYYYFTKNADSLNQACLSLNKMIAGGIYDQLGGGFARYSTDNEWLAPHFEKMLYDNALLILVLCDAYQLTGNKTFSSAIIRTMGFIIREWLSPEGGFYAALDADSEGEEGKYYVWSKREISLILGEDASLFCDFYDITESGNWEGKNILRILVDPPEFAIKNKITETELFESLRISREKLMAERSRRIPPQLDDKILLSWNALMNMACSRAYAVLGKPEYRDLAVKNMDFLFRCLKGDGLTFFYRSYKEGRAKYPAFLDDYSYLIASLIQLQEITADTGYLLKAREIANFVIDNFSEKETGFFYYTHENQQDIIFRKKEVYDGATPSGNAFMAFNLLYLSILFDQPAWKERAIKMCTSLGNAIIKYPGSFGIWATIVQANTYIVPEVVITGENLKKVRDEFLSNFIPYRVYQSVTQENNEFPLLKGKSVDRVPLIFLCWDYSCQPPVTEIAALIRLLENVQKFNSKLVQ